MRTLPHKDRREIENLATINYATEYAGTLAQAYPYVLNFGALYAAENDSRYRWVNAKTIEIPSITTTGRVDGNRDTIATAKRNYDNAWEMKTLTHHRKWSTLVHPMDIDETNMAASISNITRVYNEEHKFPEMDAYTVSEIYKLWTGAGKTPDKTVLTTENVLSVFDAMMEAMDEARVPAKGRILYVTPAVKTLLKNADQLSRAFANGEAKIDRSVADLDSVEIVAVPKDLMKTEYDFTSGWKVGGGAKQVNMLLVHPSAVITPEKYTFARLDEPSAGSEGKYVYFEESYDGVFILNKRMGAIAINAEA